MNNTLRNTFAALTVAGILTLGACKTTDDGMDDMDSATPPQPTPMSEPTPTTPTTPTDSSTVPPTGTPTDGTP